MTPKLQAFINLFTKSEEREGKKRKESPATVELSVRINFSKFEFLEKSNFYCPVSFELPKSSYLRSPIAFGIMWMTVGTMSEQGTENGVLMAIASHVATPAEGTSHHRSGGNSTPIVTIPIRDAMACLIIRRLLIDVLLSAPGGIQLQVGRAPI
ncbi:hypothetical protein AVEN_104112-1 [Araneus ventricosus]|uniref:Uncharacterized protein n=1 Tax=Araneus ventricosus TaxID=182803 RepID=A0A4Y2J8V9_ARAVE|nr:hypothetical protein AVEN_104112-1 [Araneus ventricosus]